MGTARRCSAPDLPGVGRSESELDPGHGTVPALADTVIAAADSLGLDSFDLAGHVMFGSWPVPAVERFPAPQVRAATTAPELLEVRAVSNAGDLKRTLSQEEPADYLSPWNESRHKSWMAAAAAADPRHTPDRIPLLQEAQMPTRWSGQRGRLPNRDVFGVDFNEIRSRRFR